MLVRGGRGMAWREREQRKGTGKGKGRGLQHTECSNRHLSLHFCAVAARLSFQARGVALCCWRNVLVMLSTSCWKAVALV